VTCPLCAAPSREAFTTTDRNRAVSPERFRYRHCSACGTIFLSNVPEDLGRYYPTEYHGHRMPSVGQLEALARDEQAKLELIAPRAAGGRLLEIGPGSGGFARVARAAGYQVTGLEMDPACCAFLRETIGVEAIETEVPEEVVPKLPASRVAVLWHVLEHLPRPWRVLSAVAENLEPDGTLAIAMPNMQALQFRLLRGRWAHVDAPRHLFLIPARTLASRAASLGLRQVTFTTADRAGRQWNRFGWEYALRRFPAKRPSRRTSFGLSVALATALSPLERRGSNGATYTAVFVKDRAGP
jgi:2-polyprenyl-3-methyl-5-hydroxy-6-metoxy-1,4-benzoquinol methylase